MKKPFSRAERIADNRKEDINKATSRVTKSVKWGFKEVATNFDISGL